MSFLDQRGELSPWYAMPKTFQYQNNKMGKQDIVRSITLLCGYLKCFMVSMSVNKINNEGMDVCGISLSITLSPQVFPVKKR